eukprot:EG_transcript_25158
MSGGWQGDLNRDYGHVHPWMLVQVCIHAPLECTPGYESGNNMELHRQQSSESDDVQLLRLFHSTAAHLAGLTIIPTTSAQLRLRKPKIQMPHLISWDGVHFPRSATEFL